MDASSFALIAHDLKNALGSLESELAALSNEPTPALAQHALQHCTDLRRQFIQFLTVYGSANTLQAHCEDESPTDLLASLYRASQIRHLSAAPHAHHVTIKANQADPAYWYFDRRLVQMALDAALHNASRFARSAISLGLRQEDGYLVFVIDDDGPGLGAQDPSDQSTGLGTALCRSVAQAHRYGDKQGRIRLINRPEGGARFELWLP